MNEGPSRDELAANWRIALQDERMIPHTKDSPCFSASLPSSTSAVSQVLEAISCFARRCGSTGAWGLIIVSRELLMNAIVHGNRSDPRKEARILILSLGPDIYDIVVRDEGAGFDYSVVRDAMGVCPAARQGSGYVLIEELADELEFAVKGSSVRARVRGDANRILDLADLRRRERGLEGT